MIKKALRDVQGKLPYVSCALTIIALIVCATIRHDSLRLVAHSAAAFLNCILCIYHYRDYKNEHTLPQIHLPYAVMFFLFGIIVGGHNDEAMSAVVIAFLALTASSIFYAREAMKEYDTPLQSDTFNIDRTLQQHDISDPEN